MHKDTQYGPQPGVALALIAILLAGWIWYDDIEDFVLGMTWNVQVAIVATLAAALGLAAVAALFWRPR